MPDAVTTDTVIVGAGPIGLELAAILRRVGHDYVQLDAGPIGATIAWYPRQARFFSGPERIGIAGVPLRTADQAKATREEYLAYLHGVVQQFKLPVRTFRRVVQAEAVAGGFTLDLRPTAPTPHGLLTPVADAPLERLACRRVVLAIGDMHAARRIDVPGEDKPHVAHWFDEPWPFVQRDVLIVGGRNSAAEAALRCFHAGARVRLSYRGEDFDAQAIKYWLLPELRSLIAYGRIASEPRTAVQRIDTTTATLRHLDTGDAKAVRTDAVLLLTGYEQDGSLFDQLGVPRDGENHAPRYDPATMQTPVPGVYIAGTAAAGTQLRFRLFIENCHEHAARIAAHLTGHAIDPAWINQAAQTFGLAET